MEAIYQTLFGFYPYIMQAVLFGLFALVVIFLVMRIIKIVLDAIPFL